MVLLEVFTVGNEKAKFEFIAMNVLLEEFI